ncbi:DNA cytosine methyltransferase [Curtobacterium sp. NPDC089185]|uniref:DNA cytosine methyltransferase n=1 Tax=Curtobacterium sp. NPDC089185 TaxID=3154968 RepID=UPI003415709E
MQTPGVVATDETGSADEALSFGHGRLTDFSDATQTSNPIGTFVSLYAGAGGLDVGFAMAGFAPVWMNEYDPHAFATHEASFRKLAAEIPHLNGHSYRSYAGDLLKIPKRELPRAGSADLVIGGPPCQGFSVAGKMNPTDPRSEHVFHFLDVVEQVRPRAFVLENVKALYANSRWSPIREALTKRAKTLGYEVTMQLAHAADFGVPQARERMFLVGVRDASAPFDLMPTTLGAGQRPTVRQAFSLLPVYGTPGNDSFCVAKISTARTPVLRRSPWAGMLFNGAGRPLNLDAPSMTLPASMGGNRTPIVDQDALEDPSVESWVVRYHQALWDGQIQPGEWEVPKSLRRLTVEEAAALQTFPADMAWKGPQSARFRQIGNAVPPRLAFNVARSVAHAIGMKIAISGEHYDRTKEGPHERA